MVKMITLCHLFDTPRRYFSLFALAIFATAFNCLESVGQETASESQKSFSVLLNPPLAPTDSETEFDTQEEVPQTSPEPEILMRGPLHEAFAEAHLADPQPNPVINQKPPADLKELPPEFRPEGKNIIWVAGYWSWDEEKNTFIWISGVWRDAPPKRNWIPGYWEEFDDGARWISGFWLDETLDQEELSYLPEPPSNFESGPSVEAPNDNYFYCPGYWEFQTDRQEYFWRSGHWHPRQKNWIWIPARYVWTPRGCVYRRGYWDYEFEKRGTVFAPVAFDDNWHFHDTYRYRPNYCIDTGANFFVHLFFRDNCSQYYFGDYYDNQRHNNHYHSWVTRRNLHDQYDPLMAHYCGRSHRYNDFPLLNWIDTQHRYYETYRNLRPQISLSAHINLTGRPNHHDHAHDDYFRRSKLANRYDDRDYHDGHEHGSDRNHSGNQSQRTRDRDTRSSKPVRVNDRDQQHHIEANQIAKQKSDRRKNAEARSAANRLAAEEARAKAAQKQQERDLEKQNRDLEREQKLAEIRQKAAQNKLERETRLAESKRQQELERQARSQKKLTPSQTASSNGRPPTDSISRAQQREIEKAAKKQADELKRAQQQRVLAQQRAERDEKMRVASQEHERSKQLREAQANAERERSRAATQQKIAEAKRAAQAREQQRAMEKAQRDRETANRRAQLQAKLAQEKLQRAAKDQAKEAQRQADKARRDREAQQRRAAAQAKKENRKNK
ncbi:MAG: hypothetical protein ACPIA2_08980 [Mariniblastus sp.]